MAITLKTEPAVVSGAITAGAGATIALVVAFGAPISDVQAAAILAVIPPYVALVLALAVWIRSKVTANVNVVERATPDGTVVAGEANEIATGEEIRELGDYEPKYAATPEDLDPS